MYDPAAQAGSANTMYLYLVTANGDGMYIHAPDYFDDFSFTAVPEPPSTLVVAGLGLSGFAALRRLRGA